MVNTIKPVLLIFILTAWFVNQVQSQSYGNEWIKLNQTYYRIPVPKSGIYRVPVTDLTKYQVPIGSFNPQNVQLFYKGQEIACYIKGEEQDLMEYIEFYAEKNDGWFDTDMYVSSNDQTNPYYSLINDTASVFLTWNNSFNNKRCKTSNLNDNTGLSPLAYCMTDTLVQYTSYYFKGLVDCEYTASEGWSDGSGISLGATVSKSIATPHVYQGGTNADIQLAMLTYSSGMHHINISGAGLSFDTIFAGLGNIKKQFQVSPNALSDVNTILFKSINDQSSLTDFSSVSFIKIKYPSLLNFEKQNSRLFTIKASPDRNTYIEVTGMDVSGEIVLYDITRSLRIATWTENGILKAIIPSANSEITLCITTAKGLKSADYIARAPMVSHSGKNKQRIILTNKKLWAQAQVYANYRNAYLVDVDELYNQFGYGIIKHPMAIRNFLNYVYHNWSSPPKSLLIIGKGISATATRNSDQNYANCLVPPMGEPATDVLLSNKIIDNGFLPALETGRISATDGNEVSLYFNKVVEFESNTHQAWMKNIIHFGGGKTASEQNTFKYYLSNYETTIEDTLFGGYVSTFLKASSDPLVTSKSDSVANLINQGVSLITFFGHGYIGGFDQNIDDPANFNNQGKYPLLLANSCLTGDIFSTSKTSASEGWVIIANRGAIGYLAMVYEGNASYLNLFSDRFYRYWAYKDYGATLGEIINQTRSEVQGLMTNIYIKNTIQEFTLHGDPSIILNTPLKPDLEIQVKDISFSPRNVTTEKDTFDVNIVLCNIGKTITSDFQIELKRTFYDGSVESINRTIHSLYFKDTITIKLPAEPVTGIGLNQFEVTLDKLNQVDELNENNNTARVSLFITSTSVSAIYPFQYSVSGNLPAVLKASTSDALAKNQISTFQIDTIKQFNSNFLISSDVEHAGGVVEWAPDLPMQSGKTYFWRIAKKQNSKASINWSSSSFTYRPGIKGWEQNHFGQITDDQFNFIEKDTVLQKYTFTKTQKNLRCHNWGAASNSTEYNSIGFSIDGLGDVNTCGGYPALHLVVIDSTNLTPWPDSYGDFGQINSSGSNCRDSYYFIFYMTNEIRNQQLEALINMLDNVIPKGYYFLIYSIKAAMYQYWPESATLAFERFGAKQIRFINNDAPYIFFGHKGYKEEAIEVVGALPSDEIDLNTTLYSNFTHGTITSPEIGPAKTWKSLSWKSRALEDNPSEVAFTRIFGINSNNSKVLLADSIIVNDYDLTTINPANFPKLQLEFFTRDETYKTPTQLTDWMVQYEPYTDLAMAPAKGWEFLSDTLQQGQKGKVTIAVENLGQTSTDSVVLNYWLQNSSNQLTQFCSRKHAPLEGSQVLTDTFSFSTLELSGINQFWAEINPVNNQTNNYFQPEYTHFNNLLNKPFYVAGDALNPLLDVTFNGVHIMDGDIISARPEIVISLTDENQYLALDDTNQFSLYLKSHQTGIEEKINLTGNPAVIYNAGSTSKNKASIQYYPTFDSDGTYQLRVRANDASGNESGKNDYIISFRIINESTITHVFNYPNPFSTSTRFVFELTGYELPDELRIDIMTVTGKIVKVIYLDELGPLKIGKNITTYSWDGRDMYGDPLANGVYFYKVSARIGGKAIKNRSTDADNFFTHGIGKIYILR